MTDALVLVGYLVTHQDGWQVLMKPDRARADLYAARQHATIKPMFVFADKPTDGEEVDRPVAFHASKAPGA